MRLNAKHKQSHGAGWMPFWWGSKFCKRLLNKRVRREKHGLQKEPHED